jgi:hypothetical protein
MKWTWPVDLLDPYAAGVANYNFAAAAGVGRHAADVAAIRAADAKEAREGRQRAGEVAEAARAARASRAAMAARGAEQRQKMRASADAEMARLKAAMVAAHPDKGGSSPAFIKARRIYVAARRGYRPERSKPPRPPFS